MIEILEKVELDTVEPEVVFPQVLHAVVGPLVLFADGCGMWGDGEISRLRLSDFNYRKLKEIKLQITAGDGTEWPRVTKPTAYGHRWLFLNEKTSIRIDSGGDTRNLVGFVQFESGAFFENEALPPGTRTILTIREGEIECEIQEPVDWFPEKVFGCSVKRMRHGGFSLGRQNNVYLFTSIGVRELHEFTGKLIAEQEAKS